ncbi:phage tail tape measure protein [Cereibacter sphaeroides]|uniref:phage tail tape measure protein n=1 Tax=Cereibacter sphaeroides TaxID=1063 RepID=UPI000F53BED3|nr:phage tail tape measure protein [Cereibacter sphaeroides]AZB63854.1 phage tail tape measure protein [Cereibacter sphaeroides]AZB68224.1 phage tail tape measure protein [Cereibacter sphaeroides]
MANQRLNARIVIGATVSDTLGKAVRTVQTTLGGLNGEGFAGAQAKLGAAIRKNDAALAEARMGVLDAVGAFYTLKGALGAPINAAASFETVLEDIGQKADIPVEKLGALGEQIKEVARDTNQSAMTIGAAVDALAGRGAATDVALAAAAPIGKAATAYRASTDDLAAAAWSAVDNLKVPADQIELALDAMAQAGKAGAFELRDMATYFPTLGAAYQGLGQTGVDSVADLAAALQIVRKGTGDASTAATNLGNVLQKIYANPTQKGFKKLGIDIRKEMEKAAKAGQTPIEAIAEITNKALGGDLSRLGEIFEDAQVQAGMRSLIQGMDEYKRIRQEAMQASGVLSADYERRIRTAAGATARWDASLERLSISLGTALLPPLNELLDRLIPVVDAVGRWVEANPKLASGIVAAGAGLIAFKGALSAIKFVGLLGKGGALNLLALGMNTVGKAAFKMGGAAREAVALQNALGAMSGGQQLTGIQKLGAGLGAAARAAPGLGGLVAVIGGISAPAWLGIAAAIGAVGLAWKYWDRVSSIVSGVAARIGEALQPMIDFVGDKMVALKTVIRGGVGSIAEAMGADREKAVAAFDRLMSAFNFETIKAKWVEFKSWIGSFFQNLFTRETLTDERKAELQRAGYEAADWLIEGFKALPGQMVELGAEIIQSLWDSAASVFGRLVAWAAGPETASRLTAGFKALPSQMLTLGAEIIQSLWDGMKSVFDRLVAWVGERTSAMFQPLRDAKSWVGSWFSDGPAAPPAADGAAPAPAAPVPARAVGGYFGKGPVLVGEKGPELRFENRAGFIATARQTAALMPGLESTPAAEHGREARPELGAHFRQPAPERPLAQPEVGALFRRPTPAPPPAPPEVGGYFTRPAAALEAPQPQPQPRMGAEPVAAGRAPAASAGGVSVGQIHIHAQPGQDPRAIAEEVMRMIAARARGALYDGATA